LLAGINICLVDFHGWYLLFVFVIHLKTKNKKGRGDVSTFKAVAHASTRPFYMWFTYSIWTLNSEFKYLKEI
jgi:hypothetical protein